VSALRVGLCKFELWLQVAMCGAVCFRIGVSRGFQMCESRLFRFLPILEFGTVVLFRGFAARVNNRRSECGLRRRFASNEVLLALLFLRCCDDA
jgi:hypothetical protein